MSDKEPLDSSANAGIQNDSTNNQNPDDGQADMVSKEEYLNAQAFGTKARQNEIALATKLALKDSSELHKLEDMKVKDAVTKSLLGMSYTEASAVLGADFDITSSQNTDDESGADNNQVLRQLKYLQYKEQQREVESAISEYRSLNPEIFAGDAEGMTQRIRDELENISTKLPVEERVRRAATVSLGSPMDKKSLAYTLLLNGQIGSPKGTASPSTKEANTKISQIQDEVRELWGIKKK